MRGGLASDSNLGLRVAPIEECAVFWMTAKNQIVLNAPEQQVKNKEGLESFRG